MQDRGIGEDDLVEAAQIINDTELYDIIKSKTKKTAFHTNITLNFIKY